MTMFKKNPQDSNLKEIISIINGVRFVYPHFIGFITQFK